MTIFNIANITNFSLIYQTQKVDQNNNSVSYDDVQLQPPFLIILSEGFITQFDLDLKLNISSAYLGFSSVMMRMDIVGDRLDYVIFFYFDFLQPYYHF